MSAIFSASVPTMSGEKHGEVMANIPPSDSFAPRARSAEAGSGRCSATWLA